MQKRDDIVKYIKDNKLLPRKELNKLIYKITQMNASDYAFENLVSAFDLFANKKNKHYFQEFLTIKKEEDQDGFLNKYSGISGIINKQLENKGQTLISGAKSTGSLFIAKSFVVSASVLSLPSAAVGLAIIARASAPLAVKYISNNYTTNNPTIEHMDKRLKSIINKYDNKNHNSYSVEDKNKLNGFLKLIPESQYFKNSKRLKDKIEYFQLSKEVLRCTDKYIKNFLKQQQPELTFFYINEVMKEVNKHGLNLKDVLKGSTYYTNKGFASLQCQIFDKLFKQDNMLNMLLNIKEDEKELGTEFIDDLISIVDKIYSPNKVYKSFKIITDPKEFTKDLISESINKKMDAYAEEYKKDIITWVNSPMAKLDNLEAKLLEKKSEGMVDLSHFITGKIHALNEKIVKKIEESPEKVSEILAEHILDIEKDLSRVKKTGEIWNRNRYGKLKHAAAATILFISEKVDYIKQCKEDFLNRHITLKSFIDKITTTLSKIWEKYENFKKICKEKSIMGLQHTGAFIERTNKKFATQFAGHEIMNHGDKLTPSIKSQLANIKKKANRFASDADMVNNIKKSLGNP